MNDTQEKTIKKQRVIIIILIIIILLLLSYIAYILGNIGTAPTVSENEPKDIQEIVIADDKKVFTNETEIDIFKTGKIAPTSNGTYLFYIKNPNAFSIKYNIKFLEENKYDINMKYRIKKDGQYVIGNEDKWEDCEKLKINDYIIPKDSYSAYEIEWNWEESDNDTYIGIQEENYYKIFLEIYAEEY